MQPNKTKIALIIGAMYLGVSSASMAATGSFEEVKSFWPRVCSI